MPTLSWSEIRNNALAFEKKWIGETNEHAEAKSFWDDFFRVFGISRRRIASFEQGVKIEGNTKFIDLLWKGTLLIEHKSKGKNLDTAKEQAMNYFNGLSEDELPRYVLVCDFEQFKLYDLDAVEGSHVYFTLDRLHENVEAFSFMAGYEKQEIREQDPVNIEAAEKMGLLHDEIRATGYDGRDLEILLVRIVFCLFAENTNIFNKNLFRDYIINETRADGSDLAYHFQALFEMLDTPEHNRFARESLVDEFPYVNGSLFSDRIRTPRFNKKMRDIILDCAELDWGKISPAIFGSMFQSAMNPEERRTLGAHYTSEENIMKVIKPLFLDELWTEFERIKNLKRNREVELEKFNDKLATLKFFDPACGSGNFLIISYRELRRLELEVIKELSHGIMVLDIEQFDKIKVNVNQFYGIEIELFASYIAQVAMWIIDHQMNVEASIFLGGTFARLPLKEKAMIVNDNSLTHNWNSLLDARDCNYILGNPPFVGYTELKGEQPKDMERITEGTGIGGTLDYVGAWYIKAARYIQHTNIKVAFVSTNSIVQGEQAISLWDCLFNMYQINIFFAHHTFKWTNEARGKAAVYCVIIGFSAYEIQPKTIYTYPNISEQAISIKAENINQYLIDAPNIFIKRRSKPISDVPKMIKGSQPTDGGNFIFTQEEMESFIKKEPLSEKYFIKYMGARELINNIPRYILYLKDCPPQELRKMPLVGERVLSVQKMRQESNKSATRKWADFPQLLTEDRYDKTDVLAIPRHSSENREYIPIAYYSGDTICSDALFQISNANKYIFGILNSRMHMDWMRLVSGKIKSDYRYSNTIVYNNFVFPTPTEKQEAEITRLSNHILSLREKYFETGSTLADLYDSVYMPADLRKAHSELDKAVDKAYRAKKFDSSSDRLDYLFDLYLNHTNKA